MDGFIDKFAQRKNAQEMIRANAAAEAQENERLNAQVMYYEKAMQEMRKQNLVNMENAEKVKELLKICVTKIGEIQQSDVQHEKKYLEELTQEIEELLDQKFGQDLEDKLAGQKDAIDQMIADTEDFVHRENVKVYRNVQAVIQEELPKQTDELKNAIIDGTLELHVPKALLPVAIMTMFFILANLVISVLQFLNIQLF